MWLIRLAMGRPVTMMILIVATVLMSGLAMLRMKVDIFPEIKLPRVTVVQPYGGMDPAQMEGYLVTFYEQHFFYISGVEHVSSRTIQGASVMDIYFQPDADMADAMAQVVAQVERSRAYMPPGTVTPFILRYDVGSVPVGFLVFSSATRTLGEVQDLVYARVRPVVSTTPGVSTPPPFGGNQRSIVISVDTARLSQYHLSTDDIVQALDNGNTIMPSGVVRTGDLQRISVVNSVVGNIQDLGNIPLKSGNGTSVYLKDIAQIKDDTDIQTGYALVNGRRTIYMAISKQASASTMSVVDGIKKNLPYMQSLLPDDVKVAFEFDQSIYVTEALRGLMVEGAIGALLTGGVVLLFLRDLRSSLIVVLNIPFALLAAIVGLWLGGQTVNIMTLSGLSLAVGILVDEATVTIENIHSHMQGHEDIRSAIYNASLEVVVPRLLAMLSVISVFTPSFFMVGPIQSLFVPLSLAVGLAMFASYLLSGTFVPVMSAWLLKGHTMTHESPNSFINRLRRKYQRLLIHLMRVRVLVIAIFVLVSASSSLLYPLLGKEIFPAGNPRGFQLRVKLPVGSRFEKTEEVSKQVLDIIAAEAGAQNVEVSIGYVGTQPPSYAVSNLYMWTSGPQEALMMVELNESAHIQIRALQERLRKRFVERLPDVTITFEAGDIVNKVMNFGAATPIQVDISGPNFERDKTFARSLAEKLAGLKCLRDVSLVQPLEYPTIDINVDRVRAGQMNVTVRDIGKALVSSTYSSRFVTPIYWRDPKSGLGYQVQMQVPQQEVHGLATIGAIPVKTGDYAGPFVRDVSNVSYGTMAGEFDHYNMQRMISISANLASDDLGGASRQVQRAIDDMGALPRGIKVTVRGQVPTMHETFGALSLGVLFAIVAIFLLLVAFFQSFKLSLIIISVIPAVLAGAVAALFITHSTINVQSFMGAIMAVGVGVANSILVVVFAEEKRMTGMSARTAAITGAALRLRPVLMTSIAMIAGMIPMALGMSEGGDRTAPLGRAVIGGLLVSTTAVLLVLPQIYALVQKKQSRQGASLLPYALTAILCLFGLTGCQSESNTNSTTTTTQKSSSGESADVARSGGANSEASSKAGGPAKMVVPVVRVKSQILDRKLDLPGELLAFQNVPMHAKVEGFISWIGVDRGSVVKRGQKMMVISCPELTEKEKEAAAKVSSAQSALRQSEENRESQNSKLVEAKAKMNADELTLSRMQQAARTEGAIAQNEVDLQSKTVESDQARVSSLKAEVLAAQALVESQKTNVVAAKNVLESLKAMRSYLVLEAPFDGVITERNVHLGSIVAVDSSRASLPLVRIQQKNLLRLVVAVPEECVAGIKEGMPVDFTVPAFLGKTFNGKVARLGYALDAKTRTMPVEVSVTNSTGELEPGMFATVHWTSTRPYPTMFVPLPAVATTLKGTFVVVVSQNVTHLVPVTKGQTMGEQVEIVGKIKDGDTIALKATDEYKDGTVVASHIATAKDMEKAMKQSGGGGE